MKNNHNSSRIIIAVLSCILIVLSFSACVFFLINIGSFSVAEYKNVAEESIDAPDAEQEDIDYSSEEDVPEEVPLETPDVEEPQKPVTAEPSPVKSLFPDVSVPRATPDPDFVLSQSFENSSDYTSPADIVDVTISGVVSILNYHYNTNNGSYFAFGSSSGFVVSSEGYILTNAHAVSNAKKIEVSLSDRTTVEATLVGFDLTTDIAVIKIPSGTVKEVLVLGDSDAIRVGEYVLAIGNPLSSDNLFGTVSLGIVSGKNRAVNIEGFVNMYIQTDAALNPGNSGGPLLDMRGHVIGMNTAKAITAGYDDYGNSISSEGIGFSLPINDVIAVANILIQNGFIPRPGIGITVYTLSKEDATALHLVEGIFVETVNEGSPAEFAGVKPGDVIVKLNGNAVSDKDELVEAVRATPIGKTILLTVYREGEYIDI